MRLSIFKSRMFQLFHVLFGLVTFVSNSSLSSLTSAISYLPQTRAEKRIEIGLMSLQAEVVAIEQDLESVDSAMNANEQVSK